MSVDDVPLFRIDKEAMVIELYKQRKTMRAIASLVRMNFSDIKTIIDREFGSNEKTKNAKNEEQRVYSEALKLFLGGRKPVYVAIKLGLGYDEVRKIYLQFLNLNRMYRLKEIYEEIGDNMKSVISMHKKIKENNFTFEQVQNAIELVNSLSELEEKRSVLSNDVNALKLKGDELTSLNSMQLSQIELGKRELEYYNYHCEMKKNELSALDSEVTSKRNFIQNFDKEEGLVRIKEAAKNQIESVMHDNRALLALAISATLEALRRYPANQELIFQLLTPGFSNEYQQFSIDASKNELVKLAAQIQSEIIEQIIKRTTNMKNTVAS